MIRTLAMLVAAILCGLFARAEAQTQRIIRVDAEWPSNPTRPVGLLPADEASTLSDIYAMRGNLAKWRDKERALRGSPRARSNASIRDAHRGAQLRNPSVPPPMQRCPQGRPCETINRTVELNLADDGWIAAVHGVFMVVDDTSGVFRRGSLVHGRWNDPTSLRGAVSLVSVELIEGAAACGIRQGRVALDDIAYLGPSLMESWRTVSAQAGEGLPPLASGPAVPLSKLRRTSTWTSEDVTRSFGQRTLGSPKALSIDGRCLARPDGALTCGIASLTPRNAGHSSGFYELFSKVRVEQMDRDGRPLAGRCIAALVADEGR